MKIAAISPYSPGARDAGEKVRLGALLDEMSLIHNVTLVSWNHPDERSSDSSARYEVRLAPSHLRVTGRLRRADYAIAAVTHSLVQWRATRRLRRVRRWVSRQLSEIQPDVVLAIQLGGAAATPVRFLSKTLVDTHNAEALRWRRIGNAQESWPVKALAAQQAIAAKQIERRLGRRVAALIAVTEADAQYFSSLGAVSHVVSNGFTPPLKRRPPGPLDPSGIKLLFVGSFNYSANLDALEWLAEIALTMPPGVSVSVVGSGDVTRVQQIFAASGNVHVQGRAADVSQVYAEHDVLVVPLKMGGGSRLKIIEAIAHGLVVISTTTGAEGLPLVPDRDYLVAESTKDWAGALGRLSGHPDAHLSIANSAQSRIVNMTWRDAGQALGQVISERF